MLQITDRQTKYLSKETQHLLREFINDLYEAKQRDYSTNDVVDIASFLCFYGDGEALVEAEQLVVKQLKTDNDERLLFVQASLLDALGNTEQALNIANKLAKKHSVPYYILAAELNAKQCDDEHNEVCLDFVHRIIEADRKDCKPIVALLHRVGDSVELSVKYEILKLALTEYKESASLYNHIVNYYRHGLRSTTFKASREEVIANTIELFDLWYVACEFKACELQKADCNMIAQMYPSAIQVLENFLNWYEHSNEKARIREFGANALMMLAESHLANHQYEACLADLERYRTEFVEGDVEDWAIGYAPKLHRHRFDEYIPSFVFLKASALDALGSLEEADKLYDWSVRTDNCYYEALAYIRRAIIAQKNGDNESAERLFRVSKTQIRMYGCSWVDIIRMEALGDYYLKRADEVDRDENLKEAYSYYGMCFDDDDDNMELLSKLMPLSIKLGKVDDAQNYLADFRSYYVDESLVAYYRAAIAVLKGDFKAAKSAVMRSNKIDEKKWQVLADMLPDASAFRAYLEQFVANNNDSK